jgi:hypothetical protein
MAVYVIVTTEPGCCTSSVDYTYPVHTDEPIEALKKRVKDFLNRCKRYREGCGGRRPKPIDIANVRISYDTEDVAIYTLEEWANP